MSRLKRERLLSHIANPDDQLVMAKVLDKVEDTLRTHQVTVTSFLDPYHLQMARSVLTGIRDISFIDAGGFPEAERRRIVITMDYLQPTEADAEISLLRIYGNFKFVQVTHRDYLGALMGVGLVRDKLGDLMVHPEGCYLACTADAAHILLTQMNQVHKVNVQVEEVTGQPIDLPQEPPKEISTTVSSLRLDTVLAAGFGLSRSDAADLINGEKVKLNWQVCSKCSQELGTGDRISVRGKGRLVLVEEKGLTKKGRIAITLHRSN